MPNLIFTRRFSMGHRLIHSANESCSLPHGHNEYVTVTLKQNQTVPLDGISNMPISFENAKNTWHRFVDERLDHALQLAHDDPLLQWFRVNEPTRASRIIVTPGDPTTELMACLLKAKLTAFLKAENSILYCSELSIRETSTNMVSFQGNPSDILPQQDINKGTPWWNRPDMSISDLPEFS